MGVVHLQYIYHDNSQHQLVIIIIYLDVCTGLDEVAWEPYDILLLLLALELAPAPWDLLDGSQVGPTLAWRVPAVSAGPGVAPSPSVVSDIPH